MSGLLGAIVGDVVGSAYEFAPTKATDFELFTSASRFTDDTVCTLAVAEGFLDSRGQGWEAASAAIRTSLQRLVQAYPDAGYGPRFFLWAMSGRTTPMGSFGNGSAMRVAPAAWIADDLESVLAAAEASAVVSHDHPAGVRGAQAVATAIFLARGGAEREEIRTEVQSRFGYDLDRTLDEIRPVYRHVQTCDESVPEAIIAFLESTSVEHAIRLAVSLGGDADTQAAIAGAIAEAYHGGVPASLAEPALAMLPDELLAIHERWVTALER